jgi:RHS repeat-associated protein
LETRARDLLDSTAYRTSITYDALNRVKLVRYPQDVDNIRQELRPHYNRAGALERVSLGAQAYVKHVAYNAKGQRLFIAYGNGVTTRYSYDAKTFRLVRLRSERNNTPIDFAFSPTGAPLQDFAYEYDLAGNILQVHDRTPESGIQNTQLGTDGLDRTFIYEPLYRLALATGRECDISPNLPWNDTHRCTDITRTRGYTEQYQYDPVGNIRQLKHQMNGGGFHRDFALASTNDPLAPMNNRLAMMTIGQTDLAYTYDVNGNLIQENETRRFEWDHRDRMRVYRVQIGSSEPSIYVHYIYDASGQRVKKLVRNQGGSKIETTVYIDGLFDHERLAQGNTIRQNNILHIMDNQNRLATVRVGIPFTHDSLPSVLYQLGDHLASSNVIIDASSALINREEYGPYGETSFGSVARKRYRFIGKERDAESGLYYFGARYYAAWLGKWVSPDPAGMVEGANLYVYASSNPIMSKDPSGTQSEHCYAVEDRGVLECRPDPPAQISDEPLEEVRVRGPARASQSVQPAVTEEKSFWMRGGLTMAGGAVGLGLGVLLLASNPVGWIVGITVALALASGSAGVLVGATQLATSGSSTAAQDRKQNETISSALTFASSPGSMIGGTLGLTYSGGEEGMKKGSLYGGLSEAGSSFAYGVGSMAYREYQFARLYQGSKYGWGSVRPHIQTAYGMGSAAGRVRTNALFYRGIERIELSHFVPQRAIGGYQRFFNRPWNVTPMWGTEHAMVDAYRFQRMTPAFKALYTAEQLDGIEKAMQLAPPWMLQSAYGVARGAEVYQQR